jgi:hypothetical protein
MVQNSYKSNNCFTGLCQSITITYFFMALQCYRLGQKGLKFDISDIIIISSRKIYDIIKRVVGCNVLFNEKFEN